MITTTQLIELLMILDPCGNANVLSIMPISESGDWDFLPIKSEDVNVNEGGNIEIG